jgi:hypothetical protein
MTARVDGGLAKLDLGDTAIAYAGRCNWDWWYGDRPVKNGIQNG